MSSRSSAVLSVALELFEHTLAAADGPARRGALRSEPRGSQQSVPHGFGQPCVGEYRASAFARGYELGTVQAPGSDVHSEWCTAVCGLQGRTSSSMAKAPAFRLPWSGTGRA